MAAEIQPANPAHTNRLAHEKSPYLLQHAHNPVDWYPWGEEAFAKARRENKPIFLSIGYSTCHWCHVMAHESFEDDEVAAAMNDGFVNIKVDREERPDLDAVYMNATVAMTGQGGWPMTCFLTPDGRPFFAIDFDIHKIAIHDGGDFFALEGFVRHNMAPVAGRVANREKDRFILATRLGEGFFTPRVPIDRIMRVL